MKDKNEMEILELEGEELSTNLDKYGDRLKVFNINEILNDNLIYIKTEHKKLYKGILTYIKTNVPKNILIKGVRGSGKTLLTKKFSEKVAEKFNNNINTGIHYVNCRDNFRELSVLQCILNKYQRGVSTAKVTSEFVELTKQYDRNIIILDEVEHLEDVDAIYTLTRTPNVIVIATSLTGAILDKVAQDPSVQSSFNPDVIFFGSYEVDDLYKIFDKRVRYLLNNFEDNNDLEENLKYLSSLLKKEHGADLRVGIEACSSLFQNELNFNFLKKYPLKKLHEIYSKYLSASKENLERVSLMNLDSTSLTILFSIALAKRKKTQPSVIDAYKIYDELVKDIGIGKEMTTRAFRKYLPGLQSQEYFLMISTRKGRSSINTFEIEDSITKLTFDRYRKEFPIIEEASKIMNLMLRGSNKGLLEFSEDKLIHKIYSHFKGRLPNKIDNVLLQDLNKEFNLSSKKIVDSLEKTQIVKVNKKINEFGITYYDLKVLKPTLE